MSDLGLRDGNVTGYAQPNNDRDVFKLNRRGANQKRSRS